LGKSAKVVIQPATRRAIAALLTTFGFALCEANGARADIFFSPAGLTISPPARATALTISNLSAEPLRLQVSAYAWAAAPDGSIKLTSTRDVIVFPQLVTIPGFAKQEIRAAVLIPPGTSEKTYRIVVDQLPSQQNAAQSASGHNMKIMLRYRYTVPIFQEPLVPRLSGAITAAAMKRGKVTFTILNTGNAHLGLDEIRVIGRDAAGRVIFSQPFRGWLVTVGNQRTYSFAAPQAGCSSVRSVTLAPPAYMNVPVKRIEVESDACAA
jgi:fimbrial chaperone protein